MLQSEALAILKTGANVFLTGEPGSGKSYLVREYVDYLRSHQISVAITSSTGIAATHIGGVTVHSWSGIGIKKQFSDRDLRLLHKRVRQISKIQDTSVLIIDEVSMLDADTLTALDRVLKFVRSSIDPFGGLQVVFVGDFFQLPPVSRDQETSFAFESPAWDASRPVICYLSEQHRQQESQFSDILRQIRSGENVADVHKYLLQRISSQDNQTATRLYAHNYNVDQINAQKLTQLADKKTTFEMAGTGRRSFIEQLQRGCLSPEFLDLKTGAQVMFTKNSLELGVVNGTLGKVISFRENLPVVMTTAGKKILVKPLEWSIEENGKIVASISQIPLRLAWAITIHKSQGMTLDSAVIDLSSAFEFGQGYVAISRVKSLSGLILLGLNEKALEVHPQILKIDSLLHQQSSKAQHKLTQYSKVQMEAKHLAFIDRCGGSAKRVAVKKPSINKSTLSTYALTLELFQQGKNLDEIAHYRHLKTETIVSHLEKLHWQTPLDKTALSRIVPTQLHSSLTTLKDVFSRSKDSKLSSIFQQFQGKYSYLELRIARLVSS